MVAPDYSKAKVYQLVSNKTADVYIGATVCDLCKRLSQHKNRMNKASSKRMFVNDAIITIALIEAMPDCKSSAELKARELFYITTMPCINERKPFVTDVKVVGGNKAEWDREYGKEYNKKHAEEIKKYRTEHAEEKKAYRTEHAEEIKAYSKEYNKKHAEEIKAYRTEHAEEIKAYRTEHAEEIKEYKKEYYKEHAEEFKAYRTEHAEEKKAYNEEYNKKHAEEKKAYNEEYNKNNAEELNRKRRETRAKAKAKKLAKLSTPQLQAVQLPQPM
jgi:hypothetical protein